MKLICKLRSKDGFSIGELLVATLIMLMVSSVVVGGIPVARDAYNKVTVGANSQVLLSTALASLRNELGTASDVKVIDSDKSSIEYTSMKTGDTSRISLKGTDGIWIEEYLSFEGESISRQLVGPSSATRDLYVTYDSVSGPEDSVMTFTNVKVKKKGESQAITELPVFQIRVFREKG